LAIYKNYLKIFNKQVSQAKSIYYKNIFNSKFNSSKTIWSEINKLFFSLSRKSPSTNIISKINIDGDIVSDSTILAHKFNEYFCNVGPTLFSKLPPIKATDPHFKSFLPSSVLNSFVCDNISSAELSATIYKLNSKNCSGPDNFNMKLISEIKLIISPYLLHIFNLSISSGIFPSALKTAKTIPIYKKGEHTNLNNYRPISLLSSFSKIFESLIASRLSSFLSKYNILYDFQFGFRPSYSTKLALINTVDDILKALDAKDYVAGIFFDLAKAFDSIDHSILLAKLYHYGIRGSIHKWFASYLTSRSQYTMVNGFASSLLPLTHGVPQGSVLGPLLFLIYINDIGFIPNLNVKPKLFADDTNMFIRSQNLLDLQIKCQTAINKIYEWVLANRLTLNSDKTYYMIFSPTHAILPNSTLHLFLNNQPLNQVTSARYLGVTIDNNLDWKCHIQELCLCLRRYVGIFYKLSLDLPSHVLKTLYFALIYPRILYGIEVYANTYISYLHDLIMLNNRLLRITQHSGFRSPTTDLYNRFNTLPINKLFQFQLLTHAHNVLFHSANLPKIFFPDIQLNNNIHYHLTRSNHDFHRQSFNSSFGSRVTYNLYSKLWNSLTPNLKSISHLPSFKKQLKNYLSYNTI